MSTAPHIKEPINFNAFDEKVTDGDITAYQAAGGKNPGSGWIILIILLAFFSISFFIGLIVNIYNEQASGYFSPSDLKEAANIAYISLFFSIMIIPAYFLNKYSGRKGMKRLIQMQRFTKSNGWQYSDDYTIRHIARPGIIFNAGAERLHYYLVKPQDSDEFHYGTFSYATGTGRGRAVNHWGYVEVPTKANLPHTILDAKANNIFKGEGFTTLPSTLSGDQKVSISPEVDALYTTYTSADASAAIATYITPAFIERLKAIGDTIDIEIVDGKAYAYRLTPFHPTKEDSMKAVALVELMLDTFGENALHTSTDTPETEAQNTAVKAPRLNGGIPWYVTALGMIGITVQIIVALYFVTND